MVFIPQPSTLLTFYTASETVGSFGLDSMAPTDIATFATSQLSLLDVEHGAEIEETAILTSTHAPTVLQRAGLALLNLHIANQRTGFAGKTQLELALDPAITSGDLPEHGLRPGDLCAVADQPKGSEKKRDREVIEAKKVTGVVQRVRREDISVALDKEDAEIPSGGKLWLYVQPVKDLSHGGTGRLIDRTLLTVSNLPTKPHINASRRR